MSESDFVDITRNRELCNSDGEIGQGEFQAIMRREVQLLPHTPMAEKGACYGCRKLGTWPWVALALNVCASFALLRSYFCAFTGKCLPGRVQSA